MPEPSSPTARREATRPRGRLRTAARRRGPRRAAILANDHDRRRVSDDAAPAELPLVTMLLLVYNQQDVVADAIRAALAQTYPRLEIVVSDDASTDASFDAIQAARAGYGGPHRIVVNRNPRNLGIGEHLNRMVALSHGELLFIAAGDDASLPQRCERVVQAWLAADRRPDLIASALLDMDAQGDVHGTIVPSDLSAYRDAAGWIARPPFVVGAAQAWTRRVYDRFGPFRAGVVGEDMVMAFRAIGSGGALTLNEPLVRYRRGGISRRVRNRSAADVVARLRKSARGALAEIPQLLADAEVMGQLTSVEPVLRRRLARERFVRDVFDAPSFAARLRIVLGAREVDAAARLRIAAYALCPWALAPFFFLKRLARRR